MLFIHSLDPAGLQQSHVIAKSTNHDSSIGYECPSGADEAQHRFTFHCI
jgi:hypothetical protein